MKEGSEKKTEGLDRAEIELHGFIKKYQALKLSVKDLRESCKSMLFAMSKIEQLKKGVQESSLSSFLASGGWIEANQKSELLEDLGPYDADQLNRILGRQHRDFWCVYCTEETEKNYSEGMSVSSDQV